MHEYSKKPLLVFQGRRTSHKESTGRYIQVFQQAKFGTVLNGFVNKNNRKTIQISNTDNTTIKLFNKYKLVGKQIGFIKG